MSNNNEKIAIKVSLISILGNVILAVAKFIAGIFGSSAAMLSDAVHTLSDVFSTFVVMAGIKLSAKKEDDDHPYGHEKIESIAGGLLAIILAITALKIMTDAFNNLLSSNLSELKPPTMLALSAAVASIVVKEWMYHYTKSAAKKINSPSLMADAWHHRSDALSSIGSLVGIGGAMLGFPALDPIASIVIGFMILKAAYDIAKDSVSRLTDTSCNEETLEKITEITKAQEGVLQIDDIKTRIFGAKFYVDLEIGADENLPLKEAHDIAKKVHDEIEKAFPDAKHCMVHVNPVTTTKEVTQQ